MTGIGWTANVLLLWSWWALGKKHRYALILGVVGSLMWAVIAYQKAMWDLITIEIVLASFQVRAWWLWGQQDDESTDTVHSGTTCDQ